MPSESQTVIKTTPEVKQFCGTILTPFQRGDTSQMLSQTAVKDPRQIYGKWVWYLNDGQEEHWKKKEEISIIFPLTLKGYVLEW